MKYLPLMAFWLLFSISQIYFGSNKGAQEIEPDVAVDRVVLHPSLLIVLFGGDRYLAANLEFMRLASTGVDGANVDYRYANRAMNGAARLNPCHEDGYYYANGFLGWGEEPELAQQVLFAALSCRVWDDYPAFFYGFNAYYFERNAPKARRYLELAAERAVSGNAAAYRKLGIMLQVGDVKDEVLALGFLRQERDRSQDDKLYQMLSKRVMRFEGLVKLRTAARAYEVQFGRAPDSLQQMLGSGVLDLIPEDPTRLGYEMKEGRVELRRLKILGAEAVQ